jgi:hypothetical protein
LSRSTKLAYADIVLGGPDWTQLIFTILINDLCADYIALHEDFARWASFLNKIALFTVTRLSFLPSTCARLIPAVTIAQLLRRLLERIDAGPKPDRLAPLHA